MAFLRINGWTVPVAVAKAGRKVVSQGKRGRSFRGQLRDSRRDGRWTWDVECALASLEDARTLQQLVLGRGHLFDLSDGLQASTSLLPDHVDPSALINLFALDSRGDPGRLTFDASASGAVFVVDAQLDEWTALLRAYDASAAAWFARAWRSDGATFVSGTRNDNAGRPAALGGAPVRVEVSHGIAAVVKDGTSAALSIDDLMLLPFRASDGFIAAAALSAGSAPKPGGLPELTADGDIIDPAGESVAVLGELTDSDIVSAAAVNTDLGWVSNARVVRFSLVAVDPAFEAT